MPDGLLRHRVLFFGGKGGVGKTTLAAAISLIAAQRDDRTLLVSTDPAHSTSDMLELELGPEPRKVSGSLWAMEIDPTREADRYIDEVKARVASLTAPRLVGEVERQIDIARVSPGAEEAALFDRFTRLLDELGRSYDRLVFDTAPLGHTLRLLALPEQLTLWMRGLIGRRKKVNALHRMWRKVAGAAAGDEASHDDPVLAALEERKTRFERTRAVLTDPTRSAFVFVLTPERLPLLETQRAVAVLERHRIPLGGIVVNQIALDSSGDQDQWLESIGAAFRRYPRYDVPRFRRDVYGLNALHELGNAIHRMESAAVPPSRG
ncbi:MAG: TRC40/GET3/ArsA family transport-energizing ATPase [Gemmatimonadota bacterium]|nr:TRC40/GET3/ArsA family transport-energizing ATPase [Gemmatimonadota bacterium]